jgi:hypothetical protein
MEGRNGRKDGRKVLIVLLYWYVFLNSFVLCCYALPKSFIRYRYF